MPCHYYSGPSSNPRLWEKCKTFVKNEMVAAGWNVRAGKFNEVQHRKALKLFNAS